MYKIFQLQKSNQKLKIFFKNIFLVTEKNLSKPTRFYFTLNKKKIIKSFERSRLFQFMPLATFELHLTNIFISYRQWFNRHISKSHWFIRCIKLYNLSFYLPFEKFKIIKLSPEVDWNTVARKLRETKLYKVVIQSWTRFSSWHYWLVWELIFTKNYLSKIRIYCL